MSNTNLDSLEQMIFIFDMYIMKKNIFISMFAVLYLFFSNKSYADIKLTIENDSAFILISGEIIEGDGDKF